MIGRLRGELIERQPPVLVVDVGGIGYELEAPMSTFYHLPAIGGSVTLHTHLVVRDDAQLLYGFIHEGERALFRMLLKISGVGARMALAILSGMDAQAFTQCVQRGDAEALIRLPGVGRKTAERLIIEMRDRLAGTAAASTGVDNVAPSNPAQGPAEEAQQALVALGYKPQEASRMVKQVEAGQAYSEDIIRLALKASLN